MKKPLLRSLLLSYIAVLIPFLILCGTLVSNFRAAQEDSLTQLQTNKVRQYQNLLDNELNELDLVINQVFSDNLRNRFSSQKTFSTSETDLLVNMRTQFAASVRSMDCLDEIMLYYRESGYAVTSHVILPLDTAYTLTSDAEAYWGNLDNLCSQLARLSGKKIYMDGERLYLSCAVDNRSGMLFTLNRDYLLSLYPSADPENEVFVLTDSAGNVVLQYGEAFPLDLSCLKEGELPVSNDNWFVSAQKLEGRNYYVITALSRPHMDDMLMQRIGWLLIAIPLCVLLSVWVVYHSVSKHYNPIAQLLEIANEHGLTSNGKNIHEYEQLNILLRKELDSQQSLQQKQMLERQRAEDAALFNALRTSDAAQAVSKAFSRKNLPFPQPNWCFVEINLFDYSEKDEDTMLSIARLLISTNLSHDFASVDLLSRHRLIFIVGMDGDVNEKSILLKSDLQRDMNFLKEEYGAELGCSMTEVLPWQEDFSQVTGALMTQLNKIRKMPQNNMSSIHVFQPLDDETQQALARLSKMEQDILRGHYDELNGDLKQLAGFSVVHSAAPEQKKEPGNSQIIDQVVQLVQSNYYDQNLNISYLAQQVGRHPTVLSKAFRQQMDIGLLDYIHTVRIEAAKKLLVEHPEMTVQRISELCGYSNSDSFQRTFKRITETTPGKFRDSHIQ